MISQPIRKCWSTVLLLTLPILAGGFGVWIASSGSHTAGRPGRQGTAAAAVSPAQLESAPLSDAAPNSPAPATAAAAPTGATADESLSGGQMLHEWLSSSTDPDEIGLTMVLGFPKLPPAYHADAARQMVNLVRDDRFVGLLRILLDPNTTSEAKEIIYKDVMIRPDALRLPALLNVMQKPEHPNAHDAREALAAAIGVDCGDDYEQWQLRVDAELQRQKAAGG